RRGGCRTCTATPRGSTRRSPVYPAGPARAPAGTGCTCRTLTRTAEDTTPVPSVPSAPPPPPPPPCLSHVLLATDPAANSRFRGSSAVVVVVLVNSRGRNPRIFADDRVVRRRSSFAEVAAIVHRTIDIISRPFTARKNQRRNRMRERKCTCTKYFVLGLPIPAAEKNGEMEMLHDCSNG
ncbi:hypothetical protein BHE74_00015945, partial [Ensete ventricosum]